MLSDTSCTPTSSALNGLIARERYENLYHQFPLCPDPGLDDHNTKPEEVVSEPTPWSKGILYSDPSIADPPKIRNINYGTAVFVSTAVKDRVGVDPHPALPPDQQARMRMWEDVEYEEELDSDTMSDISDTSDISDVSSSSDDSVRSFHSAAPLLDPPPIGDCHCRHYRMSVVDRETHC